MTTETLKPARSSGFRRRALVKARVLPGQTNGNLCQARPERSANKALSMPCHSGVTIVSCSHLEKVLQALYRESSRLVDTSNFALAKYDDRTDTLDFAVFEQGKKQKPCSVKFSNNQGLASYALTSQTPLLIRDLSETGITIATDPICPDQPIRSWLSVPVRRAASTNGKAQGVMVVWSDQPNAFTDGQSRLLSAIGAQAAIAIENARLRESMRAERDRVIEAEELVRKELARDLHDGPLQLVSAIKMRLDFCQKALERDPALPPEEIIYMQELAEHAVHQMRTMLFELRPLVLETDGLGPALRVFCEHRQKAVKTTQLTLNVETCQPGGEISRQKPKVEAAIFAIVQEAVNNALKHAQAGKVEVRLKETPAAIHVTVVDDGRGFEVDKVMRSYEKQGSLGLINIRERIESISGKLQVNSVPGQGTHIAIYVPKVKEV